MSDLSELLKTIDELSDIEVEQVYRHVVMRRASSVWLVSGQGYGRFYEVMQPVRDEAAQSMTPEEVDALIEEVMDEIHRDQRSSPNYRP